MTWGRQMVCRMCALVVFASTSLLLAQEAPELPAQNTSGLVTGAMNNAAQQRFGQDLRRLKLAPTGLVPR